MFVPTVKVSRFRLILACICIIGLVGCNSGSSGGQGSGSGGSDDPDPTAFTDPRDGRAYKIKRFVFADGSSAVWFLENLAYIPTVRAALTSTAGIEPYDPRRIMRTPYYHVYGYEGDDTAAARETEEYKNHGVLYRWTEAIFSCPVGWHLATVEEWDKLIQKLGNDPQNWKKQEGRDTSGDNTSGMNISLGGYLDDKLDGVSRFKGEGQEGRFWAKGITDKRSKRIVFTDKTIDTASAELDSYNRNLRERNPEYRAYSVRCVKGKPKVRHKTPTQVYRSGMCAFSENGALVGLKALHENWIDVSGHGDVDNIHTIVVTSKDGSQQNEYVVKFIGHHPPATTAADITALTIDIGGKGHPVIFNQQRQGEVNYRQGEGVTFAIGGITLSSGASASSNEITADVLNGAIITPKNDSFTIDVTAGGITNTYTTKLIGHHPPATTAADITALTIDIGGKSHPAIFNQQRIATINYLHGVHGGASGIQMEEYNWYISPGATAALSSVVDRFQQSVTREVDYKASAQWHSVSTYDSRKTLSYYYAGIAGITPFKSMNVPEDEAGPDFSSYLGQQPKPRIALQRPGKGVDDEACKADVSGDGFYPDFALLQDEFAHLSRRDQFLFSTLDKEGEATIATITPIATTIGPHYTGETYGAEWCNPTPGPAQPKSPAKGANFSSTDQIVLSWDGGHTVMSHFNHPDSREYGYAFSHYYEVSVSSSNEQLGDRQFLGYFMENRPIKEYPGPPHVVPVVPRYEKHQGLTADRPGDIREKVGKETSYTIKAGALPAGTYHWQVLLVETFCSSTHVDLMLRHSEVFSFTVR